MSNKNYEYSVYPCFSLQGVNKKILKEKKLQTLSKTFDFATFDVLVYKFGLPFHKNFTADDKENFYINCCKMNKEKFDELASLAKNNGKELIWVVLFTHMGVTWTVPL